MNTTHNQAALIMAASSMAVAAPAPAHATGDDFWLEVSAYYPNVDTEVEVSSVANGTVGTEIDLESDLDLSVREALPAILVGARISKRFSIVGEYYSLGREETSSISREIIFDDVTYPVNATLTGEFNSDIYRFTARYSVVRNEQAELGFALGAHLTDFTFALEGQGSVNGGPVQAQVRRKSVLAPLPTIGAFASVEAAPRLTIGGRIDWLSLKIDDYDGRLINAEAFIAYRVMRHVGIGVMYRYVDYRLEVSKPNWEGRVSYAFNGPAVFLSAGF